MKKQIFAFFLVLCIVFGLLPAALATESLGAAGSDVFQMVVSNLARTDTGLTCEANLQGVQSGDVFWAAVFRESNGLPGQMKQVFPLDTAGSPVSVNLPNVSDTDFVRLIWLDENGAVRDFQTLARPATDTSMSSGIRKVTGANFDRAVLQILHPDSASAANERALEEAAERDSYAYKRLIVKVKPGQNLPSLSQYGNPLVVYNPSTRHAIVQFTDEQSAKDCQAYLSSFSAIIEYVEPDVLLKSGPKASDAYLDTGASFYSWGVREIKADVLAGALREKTGLSGLVVAVADTGVQTDHPLLKDRLTGGFDFIDNDNNPQDQHSHGTHVAGTIVDCTPGLDIKIMPVRVLSASGGGSAVGIAMGIRYAVSNGAKVINLSLGGAHSAYLDEAIEEAISSGVTVVVAAGNEGGDTANHCPAHVANAITVGAVDTARHKASFSNAGQTLDIVAPGVGIKSSILNGAYGEKNGTSMAAPHVTAAAAMLKYGYPDKTPAEIQQALKDTAVDLGETGRDDDYGYGLANLEAFANGWPSGGGTSQNPETGLFALLYADGELVFQNDNQARQTKQVLNIYSLDGELPGESIAETSKSGNNSGNSVNSPGWYPRRMDITKVTILNKMRPVSTASWFNGCQNLRSVTGMENLYTGQVTDMSYMFADCRALTELDLYEFNTADVTDMNHMFYNCSALTTIRVNANAFNTNAVTNSEQMFTDAVKLTGERGTTYDPVRVNKEYARVDGGQSMPGYFTAQSDTLYAILYDDGELVLQSDNTPAAGRSVVKTYASGGAWRDEAAQIRTVTFATHIQPEDISQWFQGCYNLTTIRNLENLDTSSVRSMSKTFAKCTSLTELDLSAFDTSNVTDMSGMFQYCFNLPVLDLSSFDTANVTNMRDMFKGCESLEAIYASEKFVTEKVVGSSKNMFMDCLALTGGDGTAYNESNASATYARIDGAKPGYFTQNNKI